jgi:O-antigen ligase
MCHLSQHPVRAEFAMRFSPLFNRALLNGTIKTGATLSFICVIFYTYLPFLYLINELPIEKNFLFAGIISMALCLAVFCFILFGMRINKNLMIVIGLYILFLIYSLISFLLTPNYLNDIFTIRTLTVINPIFIVLALLCRNEKQYLLRLLYLASFVYFLFAMHSFFMEKLVIKSSVFQDIFGLTKDASYQNNNLYLGIFLILTVVKAKYEKILLKKCFLYLLSLCSVGFMLLIGGRTPLFATMVVFIIFYIVEYKYSLLVTRFKSFLLLFVMAFIIVVFYSSAINLLKDMITFQRIQILFEGGDPSRRFFLFSSAIELFMLNVKNVIFGAGINSFPAYIGEYSTGWYPHNIILELLAEYGIFGTFLFLFPIGYILRIRKSELGTVYGRNTFDEQLMFLLAIYFWAINMFTGGLRSSWVLIFFTFLLIPKASKVEAKTPTLLPSPTVP